MGAMMRASEVYLRAARLMSGRYEFACCFAITRVAQRTFGWNSPEASRFDDLFSPRRKKWAWWGNQWSSDLAERRACRVLALLFMHQIALDEERGAK
jgi:hypothetical protein